MNVSKNPPVNPPATFDITGLTEDEAIWLRDLVGKVEIKGTGEFHYSLYRKLYALTEDHHWAKYHFEATTAGSIRETPIGQ